MWLKTGGGVTRHLFGYINGSPTTWWCLHSYSNTHTFLIPFYVSTPTLLSALLLSISIVIYSCCYYLTSLRLLPQVPFATYRHGNHSAYPALHFRCLQTWSEEWRTAIFIEHKHWVRRAAEGDYIFDGNPWVSVLAMESSGRSIPWADYPEATAKSSFWCCHQILREVMTQFGYPAYPNIVACFSHTEQRLFALGSA